MDTSRSGCPVALVVEDDEAVRDLASAVLEETEFDVVACADAEAALAILEEPGTDVAFLFADVRLPGSMDGLTLARAVGERWPKTCVVVTSGQQPHETLLPERAVYLQKPWRALDVLVQAERAALNGQAA